MGVMEKRRQIALNEPHIITTTPAGVANFSTDMVGKLAQCKVEFSPVQASGTPSPSNVLPISGWNSVTVTKAGKNLFDLWARGYWSTATKNWVSSTAGAVSKPIPVRTGDVVTISQDNATATYQFIEWGKSVEQPSDYTADDCLAFVKSVDGAPKTYTVQHDCYLCAFVNIGNDSFDSRHVQLEFGNGSTYSAYTGTTYPISWTDQGTVYGGYVDLVAGELVATHGLWEMDGVTANKKFSSKGGDSVSHNYYWSFSESSTLGWDTPRIYTEQELIDNFIFCNMFPTKRYDQTLTEISFSAYLGASGKAFQPRLAWPRTSDVDTVAKANEYVNNLYTNGTPMRFSYVLRTPITYQLTPQQIKTLIGQNNIFSSANGNTTVKYWKH